MVKHIKYGAYKGLSVRAANAIHNALDGLIKRTTTNTEAKIITRRELNQNRLNLLRIRNCGRVTAREIEEWCRVDIESSIEEAILQEHMSQGTDEDDEYFKLFMCAKEVNDAILNAYKLGFKRGYIAGKDK